MATRHSKLAIALAIALAMTGRAGIARAQAPQPTPDDPAPEPAAPAAPPVADPPAPTPVATVAPTDARGWSVRPRDESLVALRWIARGVGKGVEGLMWLVFAPARGAIYVEGRYKAFSRVKDLLYNDAGTAGVLPSLAFASGFGASVGVSAFHHDLFGHHESVAVKAIFGGSAGEVYQFKFELPELAGNRFHVAGRVRYDDVANLFFAGIGDPPDGTGMDLDPRAVAAQTRYAEQRVLGLLMAGYHTGGPGFRFSAGVSGIFNDRTFEDRTDRAGTESIGEVYDTAQLVGFDGGVRTLELTGSVFVDTRGNRGRVDSGVVAGAFGGGLAWAEGDLSFLHYGAEVTGYVTAFRPGRVFALRLVHEAVSGDDDRIPFTDLPRLGGAGLLRGYRRDQFRDRLAAVATLEYRYPIHHNLSGALFAEAGEVAADYGELLDTDVTSTWHLGYGGGLVVHTSDKPIVRLDIAYGDGLNVYFSTDVLEAFARREKEL